MKRKKTFYTNDIKNPYLSKGKFLWKHNDDSKLGDTKLGKKLSEEEWKEVLNEARDLTPVGITIAQIMERRHPGRFY